MAVPRAEGADAGLPQDLLAWIEATAVSAVSGAKRLPGGNRRQAWLLDLEDGRGLFLRYEEPDPALDGDYFSLTREAGIYRSLSDTGVAIPSFFGLHPSGHAMITERADGTSVYGKLASAPDKQAVAEDLMRHLARLHAVEPRSLTLSEQAASTTMAAIESYVSVWETQYRAVGSVDPLIEFGLRWLRANLPADESPPRMVHGDAGPGNFLFQESRVTALIDWELSHLGDPHEDIAWLSMRTTLEPFPDFVACLDVYERETGRRIDKDRVRYHRVLVQWLVAVIRHRDLGADRANSLVSRALNRRLLVEAIADAAGVRLARYVAPEVAETRLGREFDAALAMLRDDIAPAVSSPFAATKVKSVARILKYLRECGRLGTIFEQEERADLSVLLGRADDVGGARQELGSRIAAGAFDDERLLSHFYRQVGRETRLMETAMGALAWRPFPPLERKTP